MLYINYLNFNLSPPNGLVIGERHLIGCRRDWPALLAPEWPPTTLDQSSIDPVPRQAVSQWTGQIRAATSSPGPGDHDRWSYITASKSKITPPFPPLPLHPDIVILLPFNPSACAPSFVTSIFPLEPPSPCPTGLALGYILSIYSYRYIFKHNRPFTSSNIVFSTSFQLCAS